MSLTAGHLSSPSTSFIDHLTFTFSESRTGQTSLLFLPLLFDVFEPVGFGLRAGLHSGQIRIFITRAGRRVRLAFARFRPALFLLLFPFCLSFFAGSLVRSWSRSLRHLKILSSQKEFTVAAFWRMVSSLRPQIQTFGEHTMMRTAYRSLLALVVVAVALVYMARLASSQTVLPSTANGEWPIYSADLKGSRYSPLDQINGSNFNKLEIAWRL